MRNPNDLVNFLRKQLNMDYCSDFDQIKAILEHVNETKKPLHKIRFRGGNQDIIEEIADRMRQLFMSKNYINETNDCQYRTEHFHALRKITFFLMLNTDATYQYDLLDDLQISHILNILPKLPKFLLISLVWSLKLDAFYYECLEYSPIWFALQFIEPAVDSIKYLEPYDALFKVERLVRSIFASICRLNYRKIDKVNKTIMLNKLHDFTMDLLRQFYTPDRDKFTNWSKYEFFKYSGFAIKHILDMLLFSFDAYEMPYQMKVDEQLRIYDILSYKFRYTAGRVAAYTDLIADTLKKICIVLQNTLQYNVMLVTIDVFLHWVEIDLTPHETLQAAIGERAYYAIKIMNKKTIFSHSVEENLKFISIRPKSLEEKIKEATFGDILIKLDEKSLSAKEKKLWLNELLTKGDLAFDNEECMDAIKKNKKLLSLKDFLGILDFLKSRIAEAEAIDDNYGTEALENLAAALLDMLDVFDSNQLEEIILHCIKLFGYSYEILEVSSLSERCTQFFNRSTADEFNIIVFLHLMFENPSKVFKRFFNEACSSKQTLECFAKALKKIKRVPCQFIETVLIESFPAKCEEKFYPNVLFQACLTETIQKEEFFKGFIYQNVTQFLELENWGFVFPLIECLQLLATNDETNACFQSNTAPLLVMAAQVMDKCRWDLVSYTDIRDHILRSTINFVQITTKKYLPKATEKDMHWITRKVSKYRSMTQYYFQKFSLPREQKGKHFAEFLRPEKFADKTEIEKFLIRIFVRCTTKEAKWLSCDSQLLQQLPNALTVLANIIVDLGNDRAVNNFRYCLVNYASILKTNVIPNLSNQNSAEVFELGLSILEIISVTPSSIYEETFINYNTIVLEIFEKSLPIPTEKLKEVYKVLDGMKNCNGKQLLYEKLKVITVEIGD